MQATLSILEAAGTQLTYDKIEIGKKMYLQGHTSNISADAWESLLHNKAFLKGPITTSQGGGYKSLNVTIRKPWGFMQTYALVRLTHLM